MATLAPVSAKRDLGMQSNEWSHSSPLNHLSLIRRTSKRKSNGLSPSSFAKLSMQNWRPDDQLRQTTFLGWRDDKKPKEVALEMATVAWVANDASLSSQQSTLFYAMTV
jgi:hypothetical protein